MKKRVLLPFYLNFTPLGDYESLEFFFASRREAEKKLRELAEEYPEYFAFIAKILVEEKKEEEIKR